MWPRPKPITARERERRWITNDNYLFNFNLVGVLYGIVIFVAVSSSFHVRGVNEEDGGNVVVVVVEWSLLWRQCVAVRVVVFVLLVMLMTAVVFIHGLVVHLLLVVLVDDVMLFFDNPNHFAFVNDKHGQSADANHYAVTAVDSCA